MSAVGTQIDATGYSPAQVDALLAQLRTALLHRPSAFPVPCGAVVLPIPETAHTTWSEDGLFFYQSDSQYRTIADFSRHHADNCAPYWVGSSYRYDDAGQQWRRVQQFFVPNDFGDLVEVAR